MPITPDDLIAEGQSLARPSLHLVTESNELNPVGFWGGNGVISPPPQKKWEHCLSLDCSWMASRGLAPSGWMSVYIAHDDCSCAAVMGNILASLSHEGLPLFGIERPSYPPLEALCLEGGEVIDRWLSELKMTRDDYNHPKVFQSFAAQEYDKFFKQHHPLYGKDTVAMVAGWHVQWPEDDSFYEHGNQVALLTLRDAEPWVEVWPDGNDFKAIWRST